MELEKAIRAYRRHKQSLGEARQASAERKGPNPATGSSLLSAAAAAAGSGRATRPRALKSKTSARMAEAVREAWSESHEATALFALLEHWPDVALEECGVRLLRSIPPEWGVHARDLPRCGSLPAARARFPDAPAELVHVRWDCPFYLAGREGGFRFHQVEPANVSRQVSFSP